MPSQSSNTTGFLRCLGSFCQPTRTPGKIPSSTDSEGTSPPWSATSIRCGNIFPFAQIVTLLCSLFGFLPFPRAGSLIKSSFLRNKPSTLPYHPSSSTFQKKKKTPESPCSLPPFCIQRPLHLIPPRVAHIGCFLISQPVNHSHPALQPPPLIYIELPPALIIYIA